MKCVHCGNTIAGNPIMVGDEAVCRACEEYLNNCVDLSEYDDLDSVDEVDDSVDEEDLCQ